MSIGKIKRDQLLGKLDLLVLRILAAGESIEQIVDAHPRLTRDHILAAIDWYNKEK